MNAKSKRSSEKSLLQSTSHLVVQGNPLVRNFTAEMSVNQLKLFYYLIGTVEKNDDSFYVVDVDYKTLYRLTTGDYIASGGKKYIDTLLREAVESKLTPLKPAAWKGKLPRLLTWFKLLAVTSRYGRSSARLVLEEWLAPFLLHQQKNFTAFQFADVAQMTGLGALKLYPLLCSFKSTGSWEVGFSDLKLLLGQHKLYSAYKDFNKRVLAPAIKEINERTGINVACESIRSKEDRRKVGSIRFTITEKPNFKKSAPPRVKIALVQDGDTFIRVIRAA